MLLPWEPPLLVSLKLEAITLPRLAVHIRPPLVERTHPLLVGHTPLRREAHTHLWEERILARRHLPKVSIPPLESLEFGQS